MRTEVRLWGREVGILADDTGVSGIAFQYAPSWIADGFSISPLQIPLVGGVQHNDEGRAFAGLFGVFADSLPDSWGQMLMDERFRRAGLNPEMVGVLERLCHVGTRGWGALSYRPERESADEGLLEKMDIAEAERSMRAAVEGHMKDVLPQVIESGASTGGARPKQRIAIPPDAPDTVWYGKGVPPPGYEPWLLKIETDPHRQYGLVEEAYYRMARTAGINVPDTRLVGASPEGVQHFAIRRFDWLGEGRLHCHTLSGLLNRDSHAGSTDYDTFLRTILQVTGSQRDVQEAFRRMIFNVSFGVRDDHAKNHAFTMNTSGTWRLSPAYDVTYSRPGLGNGLHRQMAVQGKRREISRDDISAMAETFGIGNRSLCQIFDAMHKAATGWQAISEALGITTQRRDEIADTWEFPGPNLTW